MGKFLSGGQLSKKIKTISKGGNKRYAVAFWGDGAFDFLFPDDKVKGARVICDLSMGATNPAEIRKLQKNGAKVKHIESFHGKVYLSDKGVVVASANASQNALGFEGEAKHVETGVFHGAESGVYKGAEDWFEGVWDDVGAMDVDDSALKNAQEAWERQNFPRYSAHPTAATHKGKTLLEALRDYPEIFKDISFVITSEDITNTDESQIESTFCSDSFIGIGIEDFNYQKLDRGKHEDFYDFELKLEDWPNKFINIHLHNGREIAIKLCTTGAVLPIKNSDGEKLVNSDGKIIYYHLARVNTPDSSLFSEISSIGVVGSVLVGQIGFDVFKELIELFEENAGPHTATEFLKKIQTKLAKL